MMPQPSRSMTERIGTRVQVTWMLGGHRRVLVQKVNLLLLGVDEFGSIV